MPGGKLLFQRTSPVDAHRAVFRATYARVDDNGGVLSTGLHVAEAEGAACGAS
jgi:hypothetical protein